MGRLWQVKKWRSGASYATLDGRRTSAKTQIAARAQPRIHRWSRFYCYDYSDLWISLLTRQDYYIIFLILCMSCRLLFYCMVFCILLFCFLSYRTYNGRYNIINWSVFIVFFLPWNLQKLILNTKRINAKLNTLSSKILRINNINFLSNCIMLYYAR